MATTSSTLSFLLCLFVFASVNKMVYGQSRKLCRCSTEVGSCVNCLNICTQSYSGPVTARCEQPGGRGNFVCVCHHYCPCPN
ncbi:hypothetical protein ABFS83_11G027800 [Erythranthe nasuta]